MERDPGSHAEAFQSAVPHKGSATATGAILVGLGSPSPEPAVGRSGRKRHHCRAPDRSVLSPTERPRQSVAPATPPSDAGSPQTTKADADPWPIMTKANRGSKCTVGTKHRSIAAIASAWLRRNVRQLCEGGCRRRIIYLDTVDSASSKPSLSNSPWIRGAPHNGFSRLIRRIRSRRSRSIRGRPACFHDFQRK